MANSSTPLNRAFFVRNVRTPKENALGVFLSMVGRNRQPLEVGCLPVKAVFHPVTFYRQTVESLAVTSKNLFTGVTAMKHRISSPVHLNINTIHSIGLEYEYFSSATEANLSYFNTALSNSAEPQNSNNISVAYSNTPINACFFMRSTNTPKERLKMACSSMVACYGKGFALCCVPLIAVSEPVTRYRPSLRTFAVTSKNLFSGVTAMKIFIFAAIRRTDLTNQIQKIRIFAESEKQARATLAREFILVLAGRINLKNLSQTHRTLSPFALTSTVAEVKNA
ncbi:host cell division inhibitor Icd-like protein [Avibacterium paragallinarum]|uniref:host cell division inhibitor Icd-like protein n=1 Tax=Avibacterium paragallinarum TaxID=728 RepID=UPI001F29D1AE|nr:host cell division inhibitor Icd-like protein [Avibacterium paragallinarum]